MVSQHWRQRATSPGQFTALQAFNVPKEILTGYGDICTTWVPVSVYWTRAFPCDLLTLTQFFIHFLWKHSFLLIIWYINEKPHVRTFPCILAKCYQYFYSSNEHFKTKLLNFYLDNRVFPKWFSPNSVNHH